MLPFPIIEPLKASVNTAKLGPSRKACVQIVLSGNLAWEVCGTETWIIKEWQDVSVHRLLIMVLEGLPCQQWLPYFIVTHGVQRLLQRTKEKVGVASMQI